MKKIIIFFKHHNHIFTFLGILYPIIIILGFSLANFASIWNTWGNQNYDSPIYPNEETWGYYILLIIFKLSLYIIPALIIAIDSTISNKKRISHRKYLYYFLNTVSKYLLVFLIIKLFFNTILEVDKVFGCTLFNSIEDIQTLVGAIISYLLNKSSITGADQSKLTDCGSLK